MTADRLLLSENIIHLHLGRSRFRCHPLCGADPGASLLLVRVESHIHLNDLPPGYRLDRRGISEFETQFTE